MAIFAKVEDGIVTQVIVAEQDFVDAQEGTWVQTSDSIRKNRASIGDTYDLTRDAFIVPQIFPSWILDEDSCKWEAPVTYPADGKRYDWDEDSTNWVLADDYAWEPPIPYPDDGEEYTWDESTTSWVLTADYGL